MNNSTRIKVSFLLYVLMMFSSIAKSQTEEPFTFSKSDYSYTCTQNYEKEGCRIELSDAVASLYEKTIEVVFLYFELNLNYANENEYRDEFPSGSRTVVRMALGFENGVYLHKAVPVERSGQLVKLKNTNLNDFMDTNQSKIDSQTFLTTILTHNITEISMFWEKNDGWGFPELKFWSWELNTFKTAPTIKAMMQRIVAEQGKSGSNSNSNSGGNAKVDWRTQMRKVFDNTTENYSNGAYKGQKSNGFRHGLGVYWWNETNVYYWGNHSNGLRHDNGICIVGNDSFINYCSGCIYYVGNWSNNVKHGKGNCYDKEGNLIYSGDFSNDRPTGTYPSTEKNSRYKFECIEYDSGDKYVGETYNGQRHGYGIYLWKNGDAWYGPWKDGNRDGKGIELYYNGNVKYGRWVKDTYYTN